MRGHASIEVLGLAGLILVATGCDNSGAVSSTDDRLYPEVEGAVCQPRALATCNCDDGTTSVQFCASDASGWGECQCCGAEGIDCASTVFACSARMPWIEYAIPVYGPSDVLFAVSEGAIQRFDCAAGIREQVDGPGFEPRQAAVFSDGSVAVRGAAGEMVIVSATGETIPLEVSEPQTFAIDAEDRLWISRACPAGGRGLAAFGADGALLSDADPCDCRCNSRVQRVGDDVVGVGLPDGPVCAGPFSLGCPAPTCTSNAGYCVYAPGYAAPNRVHALDVVDGAITLTALGEDLPPVPDTTGSEQYYRALPEVGDGPSLRTVLAMEERTGVPSWLQIEAWLTTGLASDYQSARIGAGTFGMEIGADAIFQRGDRFYVDVNARDGDAGPFPIIVLERSGGIAASLNDTFRLAVDSAGNVATVEGGTEILLLGPDLTPRSFD